MADAVPLPELVARLTALDALHGVERIRAARELVAVARASVTAAGDQGAWEATRKRGPDAEYPWARLTRREVVETLGVARSIVDDAIARHSALLRAVARTAESKPAQKGRSHRG